MSNRFRYTPSQNSYTNNNIFESNWDERIEKFDQLELKPELLASILQHFEKPSHIQSLAINPISLGRNVIAQSPNSTGRSFAFIIGILQRIKIEEKTTQALIIVPSKELADIIFLSIQKISAGMEGLNILTIKGDSPIQSQIKDLKKRPHIVIATPGRILTLINNKQKIIQTRELKIFCMVHADGLFDKIMRDHVQKIISKINNRTQFLLFSKSISSQILNSIQKFNINPVKILFEEDKPKISNVIQFRVDTAEDEYKFPTLIDIYDQLNHPKIVVFANTNESVETFCEGMQNNNFNSLFIHNGLSESERKIIIYKFLTQDYNALFSTDVCETYCIISDVLLVINLDIPLIHDFYNHRIGCKNKFVINICNSKENRKIINVPELNADFREDFQKFTKALPKNTINNESSNENVIFEKQQENLSKIQDYFNNQNEIYESIRLFLYNEDPANDEFYFDDIINNVHFNDKKEDFRITFTMLSKMTENIRRKENFNNKIEQIFQHYSDTIKQTFTNSEIYKIFENNKLILLYLFEHNVIKADKIIISLMRNKGIMKYKTMAYFYPEIKDFINEEETKNVESILFAIGLTNIDEFKEKRKKGENYDILSEMIRQDSVESFISYVNRSNLSLKNTTIDLSIFQTHSCNILSMPTLIEYAAFCGSIKIFRYLLMNNVELPSSLWIYSIYSENAELIHLLEENKVKPQSKNYELCLKAAIKCHFNDISEYIINNLMNEDEKTNNIENNFNENLYLYCFHYFNFHFIPTDFKNKYIILYAIKYNYYELVKLYLQYGNFDMNTTIILLYIF